jgi:tetratricopeptide (TPR) repeat protein
MRGKQSAMRAVAAILTFWLAACRPTVGAPPGQSETVPPPVPSPTATPTGPLVLVAGFGEAPEGVEVREGLADSIEAALDRAGLDGRWRVAYIDQAATTPDEAQTLRQAHGAHLLVWGMLDGETLRIRLTGPHVQPDDLSQVMGSSALEVAEPESVELRLLAGQPVEAGFVSGLLLGWIHLLEGNYTLAYDAIAASAQVLPSEMPAEMRQADMAAMQFYIGYLREAQGRPLDALGAYSQALRADEALTPAHFNRGNAYFLLGDYASAIREYDAALDNWPDSLEARANRGRAYRQAGLAARALLDAQAVLEAHPDRAHGYNERGLTYYALGEYDRALDDFERAREFEPGSRALRFNLAMTYLALGRPDEAIPYLEALVEEAPHDAGLYLHYADALREAGRVDEARQAYNRAVQLAPEDPAPYLARADFQVGLGEYDRAIVDLEAALGLSPDDAETYRWLGDLYMREERYAEAVRAYTQVLALLPDDAEAYVRRAQAWQLQRRTIAALYDYWRARDLGWDDPATSLSYGFVAWEVGRYEEAVESFESAIEGGADGPDAYAGLALALDTLRDRSAAEQAYRHALDLNPRFADPDYLAQRPLWFPAAVNRARIILERLSS